MLHTQPNRFWLLAARYRSEGKGCDDVSIVTSDVATCPMTVPGTYAGGGAALFDRLEEAV